MPEEPRACDEWQGHLAGWVVAQLPPDDEAAWVDHVATCAACRAEADRLVAVAAVLLGADPGADPWRPSVDEAPPPDLADRIVARVRRERRAHRVRRAAIGVAGAAAVLTLVLTVAVRSDDDPLDGESVVFARRAAGVDGSAIVAPAGDGSLVELTASGLDPDLTYALWLTPPGGGYPDRVAAGTFRPDEHGNVDVRLMCALPADEMGRAWATTPEGEVALDTESS